MPSDATDGTRFALEVLTEAENRMEGQLRKKLRDSYENKPVAVDVLMSMGVLDIDYNQDRVVGIGSSIKRMHEGH